MHVSPASAFMERGKCGERSLLRLARTSRAAAAGKAKPKSSLKLPRTNEDGPYAGTRDAVLPIPLDNETVFWTG